MSKNELQRVLLCAVTVLAALARGNASEPGDDQWRPSTRYVSMQPATVPRTGGVTEPAVNGAPSSLLPAAPPECAAYREETYTVRRPVIETSYREERCVRYEPVTTFVPQQVDQGAWVDEQVVRTGRTTTQLRWVQGGWTVDPATGREYWRLPMLRPVRVRQPDKVQSVRVWKPNLVTLSVPKVSYQPRVQVRQVPVQNVRYVEERRVRRVPIGLAQPLAPPACIPQRTFASPPPALPALGAPPALPDSTSPSDPPGAAAPAGSPPAQLPPPAIDPRENVPGPFMLPQSRSGDDKIQRTRDLRPDRVAATRAAYRPGSQTALSAANWS